MVDYAACVMDNMSKQGHCLQMKQDSNNDVYFQTFHMSDESFATAQTEGLPADYVDEGSVGFDSFHVDLD